MEGAADESRKLYSTDMRHGISISRTGHGFVSEGHIAPSCWVLRMVACRPNLLEAFVYSEALTLRRPDPLELPDRYETKTRLQAPTHRRRVVRSRSLRYRTNGLALKTNIVRRYSPYHVDAWQILQQKWFQHPQV